ncbi:MAG: biopolymer transporter ExbD [Rikenellaceae bacterium]
MKKKGNKSVPAVSTSSLPDIIYMLLFFFMVTTVMREVELQVQIKLPEATEIQKLEKKSLVSYIYVGPPTKQLAAKWGDSPRIQLNGAYKQAAEITDFIAAERDKLSESDRNAMTVSLKADRSIRMGIITDIKQELRKANALKLSYTAQKGMGI